jgi:hypothetical protein
MIWINFRSFSRQDSLPRHLEELPEDPFNPLPAPLVPPLDLRGGTNKRLQQQQQQQQMQSINTRAFSKDPHYEEQHGERWHPEPTPVGGRRNPAFAPDVGGGSPVTYYPKIKDSLSLARARLDADLADDVSGGAETTFGGGAYGQWPEGGGAGGGGIQGLQEMLLHHGGGAVRPLPRPRDSIEIYQEHYLQVRATENKDDI